MVSHLYFIVINAWKQEHGKKVALKIVDPILKLTSISPVRYDILLYVFLASVRGTRLLTH